MTSGTVNKPWPFSTCSAGAGLAAPAAPVAEPGITSAHGCTCFCRPLEVLWHYSEKMDIASKLDGIFDDLCFCSDFFVINLLHRLKFWGGSCFGMFTITVLSILRHHFNLSRRTFVVRTSSNAKNGGAFPPGLRGNTFQSLWVQSSSKIENTKSSFFERQKLQDGRVASGSPKKGIEIQNTKSPPIFLVEKQDVSGSTHPQVLNQLKIKPSHGATPNPGSPYAHFVAPKTQDGHRTARCWARCRSSLHASWLVFCWCRLKNFARKMGHFFPPHFILKNKLNHESWLIAAIWAICIYQVLSGFFYTHTHTRNTWNPGIFSKGSQPAIQKFHAGHLQV